MVHTIKAFQEQEQLWSCKQELQIGISFKETCFYYNHCVAFVIILWSYCVLNMLWTPQNKNFCSYLDSAPWTRSLEEFVKLKLLTINLKTKNEKSFLKKSPSNSMQTRNSVAYVQHTYLTLLQIQTRLNKNKKTYKWIEKANQNEEVVEQVWTKPESI